MNEEIKRNVKKKKTLVIFMETVSTAHIQLLCHSWFFVIRSRDSNFEKPHHQLFTDDLEFGAAVFGFVLGSVVRELGFCITVTFKRQSVFLDLSFRLQKIKYGFGAVGRECEVGFFIAGVIRMSA